MGSQIFIIKKSIENNPNLEIIKYHKGTEQYLEEKNEFDLFSMCSGYSWSPNLFYDIAPINPLHNATELQEFMTNLVPDLKPTLKQDFKEDGTFLTLGKLYFEEVVGEEIILTKEKIKLKYQDLIDSAKGFIDKDSLYLLDTEFGRTRMKNRIKYLDEFSNKKRTKKIKTNYFIRSQIYINLYPSAKLAMALLHDRIFHIVDKDTFKTLYDNYVYHVPLETVLKFS